MAISNLLRFIPLALVIGLSACDKTDNTLTTDTNNESKLELAPSHIAPQCDSSEALNVARDILTQELHKVFKDDVFYLSFEFLDIKEIASSDNHSKRKCKANLRIINDIVITKDLTKQQVDQELEYLIESNDQEDFTVTIFDL